MTREELITTYTPKLRAMTKHQAFKYKMDADDLFQMVCIKLLTGHQYEDRGMNFMTWASRVSWNLCVDHWRYHVRHQGKDVDLEWASPVAPRARFEDRQHLAAVYWSVRKRWPRKGYERIAWMMAMGWKYEELAAMLGMPVGTLKGIIFRVREHLNEYVHLR